MAHGGDIWEGHDMGGSGSLALFDELFNYNYWARDRALEVCQALTEEQLLRPLGNSFSSIRDTLAHQLAAEWLWLERWRGRSPAALIAAQEFPTLASISERWKVVEREMRSYLASLTEADLPRTIRYANMQGQVRENCLWRMLFHVINHQSYHRGQIATLLRQVGAAPLPVDFLIGHEVGFRG